jgi:hypothetical protein
LGKSTKVGIMLWVCILLEVVMIYFKVDNLKLKLNCKKKIIKFVVFNGNDHFTGTPYMIHFKRKMLLFGENFYGK